MTATTALTAQNTLGVYGIHHVPQDFLVQQIDACVDDIGVDVVKTGMLASTATIEVVARSIGAHGLNKVVIDPVRRTKPRATEVLAPCLRPRQVMVSTSGAQLLPQDAVRSLRTALLGKATVLTPNIPEARLLLSDAGAEVADVESVADLERIARAVQELGPEWVLVKGGHAPLKANLTAAKSPEEREVVVDVLYGHGKFFRVQSDFQDSKHTHGTGCSLACKSLAQSRLKNGPATDASQPQSLQTWPRGWMYPKLRKRRADISRRPFEPRQGWVVGTAP
jgi:hydroxymethylpyrimidine/phosphomethylpyrimidine kinase